MSHAPAQRVSRVLKEYLDMFAVSGGAADGIGFLACK
jgi:hypothetical protein